MLKTNDFKEEETPLAWTEAGQIKKKKKKC